MKYVETRVDFNQKNYKNVKFHDEAQSGTECTVEKVHGQYIIQ